MLKTLISRVFSTPLPILKLKTEPKAMRDIVAVIGTTGVGKSQLAVSLAQSLSSHESIILSADSMQLYTGLDVITNKVTVEEQGGIKHWGLDMVQVGKGGNWEVGKWCGEADQVVQNLPESTLPIVCGGTHYFIQHFLFPPSNLAFSTERQAPERSDTRWTPPCELPALDLPLGYRELLETFWKDEPSWPNSTTEMASETQGCSRPSIHDADHLLSLWKLLEMIDRDEAQRWHWRDGRKVKRGIERWWERQAGIGALSMPTLPSVKPRFRTLIFWVYDSLEKLRPRLDLRVDRMVEKGLLKEIEELRDVAKEVYGREEGIGHEEGIFQAIGYKEFAAVPLPSPDATSDTAYASALERTKLSTHQYAKSQLQWIRKQLLPVVRDVRKQGAEAHVYVVPGGSEGEGISREILKAFTQRVALPPAESVGSEAASELLKVLQAESGGVPDIERRQVLNARQECAECSLASGEPVQVLVSGWEEHVVSKVHARSVGVLLKRSDPDEWLRAVKERSAIRGSKKRRRKEAAAAVVAGDSQELDPRGMP